MQETKERVALSSIAVSAGLTVAKAVVGFMTGSLAILSEAAHSLTDFIATVITYFAVKISGKPADDEHHYGHGKVESVAALIATALLFVLSFFVIWEGLHRLFGGKGHHVDANIWAFGVIIVSIVADFFRARLLYKVAGETSSHALEADALHFDSDMWSSMAVLAGLALVWLGYAWADAVAAILVAILICIAGWRLGRRTIETLTDTAPAGVAEQVEGAVKKVKGVVSVDRVRVRPVGSTLFVETNVGVSRTLPLDRVAKLKESIEKAIRKEVREAEISVVTEPRMLSDETVLERVMVIARNRALAVHHVTVHQLQGKLAVSLDLEVDGSLPLREAHKIAHDLEAAITDEFDGKVEVETHIEPLQTAAITGRDAPQALQESIVATMRELARDSGPIRDVHAVRVRETPKGLVVNFHCRAQPGLPVEKVHLAVDVLERKLREKRPEIHRVIGHAEPTGISD
jgi:cation diffusion facilitator family transporter